MKGETPVRKVDRPDLWLGDGAAKVPVNAIRSNRILRIFAVMAAFSAWLVLSNHCALAELLAVRIAPIADQAQGCCNHQSAPARNERQCPPMPEGCCKSLSVLLPDFAKLPVQASLDAFGLLLEWMPVMNGVHPEVKLAAAATGPPPDVPGFVELVLHRSLRSHAPPLAA